MSYGYPTQAPAPVPQQGQALVNLEPAYVEEIKKCVNNGRLSISIEGIYTLIHNKITVGRGKGQTITPMDVITVLKTAVSAGLDPTSDDVFAFKTDDRTIVGISKKGWSKIVDTRKASVSYEYGPTIPARGIKQPSRFEWISVTIKKHDGSEVTGPRVYSDEFDQGRGVWTTNPKSMLAVRAFTHACAIAFGIGAYDEDEARSIFTKSEGRPPYNEQAQILPQEPAPQPTVAFEQAGNISELNKAFNALPLQKRQNPSTVEAFKQAKGRLINATTSTPQLESTSND